MPVLCGSEFVGEVVWLGHVPAGASRRAHAVKTLNLGFGGDKGARHEGEYRSSCPRVGNLYPEGTEIRNVRQLSLVSAEEMEKIAKKMGIARLDPVYLGVSIVLSGIPDFTHVPPSSRLQADSGLTVTIDMENRPCVLPGREIEKDQPGYGALFKPSAMDHRGVTGWVERPGDLNLGDKMKLFVPEQRAWAPGG